MEWKIVFEADLVATHSLYSLHMYWFLSLVTSFFLAGSVLCCIVYFCSKRCRELPFDRRNVGKLIASIIILMFVAALLLSIQSQVYTILSSNMVLTFFPELIEHYGSLALPTARSVGSSASEIAVRAMRAPVVDISRPLVALKKPIKHVFLVVLESIRADVLPLDTNFAKTIGSTFLSNTTADNVTPFLSALWNNSVRTVATTTASYTFKSLLGIFCGIYPLNNNFLVEVNSKNTFYQRCLPELIRQTFRTSSDNRSTFHSGFFTAAQGDFDHQEELSQKLNFDYIADGDNIHRELKRKIPKLGYFGPPDPYVLPLMWHWIDKILSENPRNQLFTSLVLTGTHEPFPMPPNQSRHSYHAFVAHDKANKYLNTLRICDDLLRELVDDFKSRNLYEETLFVIVGDHGFVFNDHGRSMLGNYRIPIESAFRIPFMLHNPHLEAKEVHGQFTNMDILPTIMDVLLSSANATPRLANQLLAAPSHQLQRILSQYEGTSILRMSVDQQPVRYTFSLANPGNTYVIVKQYPKKLTYDVISDKVCLYHLGHDPFEFTDLIALGSDPTTYPSWLELVYGKQPVRTWRGRWISENNTLVNRTQALWQRKDFAPISNHNTKVLLEDMLDWAELTLDLARLWRDIVKQRYQSSNGTFIKS